MILVLVGATAVGKSAVMSEFIENGARFVTSTTSRKPRKTDRPQEYEYVSLFNFWDLSVSRLFCWDDTFRQNRYGTRRAVIDAALQSQGLYVCALTFKGLEILLDRQRTLGGTVVCVYLFVEDGQQWLERLEKRGIQGDQIEKERAVLLQWNQRAATFGPPLSIIDTTHMSIADVVRDVDLILKQHLRGPAL